MASIMAANANNNNNNNNVNNNGANANDNNINESNTNADVTSMTMIGLGGRSINRTRRSQKVRAIMHSYQSIHALCIHSNKYVQNAFIPTR